MRITELLRLDILPEGYIDPSAQRPARDMLRRRMLVVHQATQTLLSLQSMVTRHSGQSVSAAKLKEWTWQEVRATFTDPYSQQTAAALVEFIEQRRIQHTLEKQVLTLVQLTGPFQRLVTIPGIGNILGLTIALETGPIARFAGAGQYASYCRTVNSRCTSAGKMKGPNNCKNGNQYLAWAFVEAANFAQRYSPQMQAWFARKGRVVAVKAGVEDGATPYETCVPPIRIRFRTRLSTLHSALAKDFTPTIQDGAADRLH